MSRRSFITNITPLPQHITRDQALKLLHDHEEMIRLNPLVIGLERTKAHPDATLEEEVNCIWYEITDIIHYLPGGIAKGQVKYKAAFHDLPDGIQTHCFAPAGVDLKARWKVGGNMPGEPPEPAELGVDTPNEGLYLREDVEVRANILLSGTVKSNLKKSHRVLVERLLSKAEDELSGTVRLSLTRTNNDEGTDFNRHPIASFTTSTPVSPIPSFRPMTPDSTFDAGDDFLNSAAPSLVHTVSEPCSCAAGGHDPMCVNYRYGDPISAIVRSPSRNSMSPQSQETAEERLWPLLAAGRSEIDRPYSPAGDHPASACRCDGSEHRPSCAYYAATRVKPSIVTSNNAKLPFHQQASIKSFGRFVWQLPPGGSKPMVKYRSPQLFGECAELNTVSTDRDEDFADADLQRNPLLAKKRAQTGLSELDGTELAYWENGSLLKASTQPAWL